MKLTLNKEFLRRHLFAIVVFAGMGLWFGYDGCIAYPKMTAPQLYESIESAQPPASMTDTQLQAFKAQKIATQHGLCLALLVIAAVIGLHLLALSRLRVDFDDNGFHWRGKHYAFSDIQNVDRSKWAKKGILKLTLADGTLTLDSWHHTGVAEFEKRII